jgi:hypothetical protein
MRRPISRYDMLLLLLGSLAKALFIGMFICTVLVVLAGMLGFGSQALLIYRLIWALFWRSEPISDGGYGGGHLAR